MQLAKIHKETGKLILQQPALKHLRGLKKGILIVALFGGARSAKSTTANMLLGKQVFGMSNGTDACTLGVWMDTRTLDNKVLMIVDSEGMGKGDTSQHAKILALVALLASDGGALIDNEMKDLGEHNLGTLGVLATMQQMVRGAQKYSWPALFVLLRDFTLRLMVAKRPATPTQYLNHILEDPGTTPDQTRKLIRDCFQYRALYTFPPPTEQEVEDMLHLPPGQFSTVFEAMRTELLSSVTNKVIGEVECNGEQLADYLEMCVEALNKDDGLVDIPNVHDVVVERFCRRLVEKLEKQYEEEVNAAKLTGDEEKLKELHNSAHKKLLTEYEEATSNFVSERVQEGKETLEANLKKELNRLVFENQLMAKKQKEEKEEKEKKEKKKEKKEIKERKLAKLNRADLGLGHPVTVTHLPGHMTQMERFAEQSRELQRRMDRLEHRSNSPAVQSPIIVQPAQPVVVVVSPPQSPAPPTVTTPISIPTAISPHVSPSVSPHISPNVSPYVSPSTSPSMYGHHFPHASEPTEPLSISPSTSPVPPSSAFLSTHGNYPPHSSQLSPRSIPPHSRHANMQAQAQMMANANHGYTGPVPGQTGHRVRGKF